MGEGGAQCASDRGQLRGVAEVVAGADGLGALAGAVGADGVADDPLSPLDNPFADPPEDPFDDDSDDDPFGDPVEGESPELDPDDGAAAPAVLAADLADPPRLSVL